MIPAIDAVDRRPRCSKRLKRGALVRPTALFVARFGLGVPVSVRGYPKETTRLTGVSTDSSPDQNHHRGPAALDSAPVSYKRTLKKRLSAALMRGRFAFQGEFSPCVADWAKPTSTSPSSTSPS